MTENTNENVANEKLVGLLAQFEDPDSLLHACEQARDRGYKKMDSFTPFPVHGIEEAMGVPRTILPFIVLIVGMTGCFVGLFMQYYTNAADWSALFPGYAFKISGKPLFSIPANIPVTFEVVVLSSAIATFLGMWALNGLPRLANPLHRISRFRRATNDKFFLMIETKDPQFDHEQTGGELNEWGASAIEDVKVDMADQQLPGWLQMVGLMVALLMLIPPVLIFRAQGMTNRKPRLHVVPDMDWQDKSKTQTVSPNFGDESRPDYLFADGRAMQTPIEGTIARGHLVVDPEYRDGIKAGSEPVAATITGANVRTSLQEPDQENDAAAPAAAAEPDWVDSFPPQVTVDADLLERGKARFEIYCSVCHGYSGNGDGLVNQRALALNASGSAQWTAAQSFHNPDIKKQPVGRIYNTITYGRGTMGPYKDQIPIQDRWAIVAYVRALQQTGIKPPAPVADAGNAADTAE